MRTNKLPASITLVSKTLESDGPVSFGRICCPIELVTFVVSLLLGLFRERVP